MASYSRVLGSEELRSTLRAVFDSQIPNFGSYNLVYASSEGIPGPAADGSAADGSAAGGPVRHYVVGYRWQPAEIILAPFDGRTLRAVHTPTAINSTNLFRAARLPGGGFEVSNTTDTAFRFRVAAVPKLSPDPGHPVALPQEADRQDFESFMADFIRTA